MAKSLHQIRSFNGAEACASEMAATENLRIGVSFCASMGPRRVPRKWLLRRLANPF
jgi:hypothetical protein